MMVVREQKQAKKSSGVVISLTLHAIVIALLFIALTKKNLNSLFLAQPHEQTSLQQQSAAQAKKQQLQLHEEKKDPVKKQPTLNQPFVVPAPVVFYGNQTMMNKPVPVSGSREGKSAFEHSPSSLPTPPAPAIAPERVETVQAPDLGEKAEIARAPKPQQEVQEIISPHEEEKIAQSQDTEPIKSELLTQKSTFLPSQKNSPEPKEEASLTKEKKLSQEKSPEFSKEKASDTQKKKQQAKKLTLADLFKNSTTTIASFAQDGLPSARKAGTEGGDDLGSGHQITIKEGDMKYYTLWAKFLNHLNQSAHFSRRGKERMIEGWIQSRAIQYVLQCGITVDMQGKLLDIEIMVSSGCPDFDKVCIFDIRSAVPYPPLPESLGKKTARFEVNVYP